jgi:2-amino-4-hydroxy-6-hydroxymethyldihydropteridine diphosphokinase
MNKLFLLIGGNEGDIPVNLARARENIEKFAGPIRLSSSLYETAPWGSTDQADFINQALAVDSGLEAQGLMTILLEIEQKMGRIRTGKWASRIIDIDILFFNDEIIDRPGLCIPHPEIQNRRFALAPMEEIAPDHLHPVLGISIRELLVECRDQGNVKKIIADNLML